MKFSNNSFQPSSVHWALECLGEDKVFDLNERSERFLEEALELCQSMNQTRKAAHRLVDYVYDRAKGDSYQEVGGVLTTLAVLCHALNLDMNEAGEVELERIFQPEVMEKIKAKTLTKPRFSGESDIRTFGTTFGVVLESMRRGARVQRKQGTNPFPYPVYYLEDGELKKEIQDLSQGPGEMFTKEDLFAEDWEVVGLNPPPVDPVLKEWSAEAINAPGTLVDLGPFNATRPNGDKAIIGQAALDKFIRRIEGQGGIPVEIGNPKQLPVESQEKFLERFMSISLANTGGIITSVIVREVTPGGEQRIFGVVKPAGPMAEEFTRLLQGDQQPCFSMRAFTSLRRQNGEVRSNVEHIVTFDIDPARMEHNAQLAAQAKEQL